MRGQSGFSRIAAALLLLAMPAAPAAAQVLTELHLDEAPPGVDCDVFWQQQGVAMYFTQTAFEDCDYGDHCALTFDGQTAWMYPGRLMIQFAGSHLVYRVEIDVRDYCGQDCTRAFVYDRGTLVGSDSNETVGVAEVLVVDLGAGADIDAIAVSTCEGEVLGSIRVYAENVANEATSWGAVKARYR